MASQGATDVLRNAHTDLSTAPTLRRLKPEEAAAPRITRRGDTQTRSTIISTFCWIVMNTT